MKKGEAVIDKLTYPVYSVNTLIIGSGSAGLNAAIQLFEAGVTDIAIVTEGLGYGTSNNAGSDKQTYYKLSLDSLTPDTPYEMAKDLAGGGCMHGDIALCEAQYSVPAFYNLVRLGVPFPHDDYGSFPGYVTDHDSKGRGTSAGPLTSRFMVGALLKDVTRKGIKIFDRKQVISLIVSDNNGIKEVKGAIAVDNAKRGYSKNYIVFLNAVNVVLATGGPGDLYKYSVYPESQKSSIGMALRAGAMASNLTESQFGIASLNPRWNLSGSYQQVMPRYFSTDRELNGPKDFLDEFFPDTKSLCGAIFLKGYQWPFDPRKVLGHGSSLIDLLVYREINKLGRRVFIDFTRNPGYVRDSFSIDNIPPEARQYLKKSGALQKTPFERLVSLNKPAVELYLDKGIDLSKDPLEVAVCAQHNNGGLSADIWWESNIRHLFPVGEICGTHGIYRPGGAALNSGQVGGFRAAKRISEHYNSAPPESEKFVSENMRLILKVLDLARVFSSGGSAAPDELIARIQSSMSDYGGQIRNPKTIIREVFQAFDLVTKIPVQIKLDKKQLGMAFRIYDLAITRCVFLESIRRLMDKGIGSRGSYLVMDQDGIKIHELLEDEWKIRINNSSDHDKLIQEIWMEGGFKINSRYVNPRPVPEETQWFETLWKEFRDNG